MPDALSPVLIFTVFERYHCAVFTAMQTEVRKVKSLSQGLKANEKRKED